MNVSPSHPESSLTEQKHTLHTNISSSPINEDVLLIKFSSRTIIYLVLVMVMVKGKKWVVPHEFIFGWYLFRLGFVHRHHSSAKEAKIFRVSQWCQLGDTQNLN